MRRDGFAIEVRWVFEFVAGLPRVERPEKATLRQNLELAGLLSVERIGSSESAPA